MSKQHQFTEKVSYEKPWGEEIEFNVSQSILVESYGDPGMPGTSGNYGYDPTEGIEY